MSLTNSNQFNLYQNVRNGLIRDAEYQKTGIPHYDGHPFIEALPPIQSEDEFIRKTYYQPDYDPKHRQSSNAKRGHLIQNLFNLRLPTNNLLYLEQMVGIILRRGLVARNPLHAHYWRSADKNCQTLRQSFTSEMVNYSRSSMLSLSVIGISGSGKSTAMQAVLSQYPQAIFHRNFEGNRFGFTQIVYLYIETPPDGSVKQICLDILRTIDDILDTTYYRDYGRNGRSTVHQLVGDIARVTALHTIGMLVIDEVQNLSSAKSGGGRVMLNFFVNLINIVNLPVILIGTPLLQKTIGKEFRMARRLAGHGDIIFNNLIEGEEWNYFVETLWQHQYTKKISPLTDEINKTLYHYSQGIIDILIKLYASAQMRAIANGAEEITPQLIKTVFHDYFQSLGPAIEALRSGDLSRLADFPDIQPVNIQAHVQEKLFQNHSLNVAKLSTKQKRKENKTTDSETLEGKISETILHKENSAITDLLTNSEVLELNLVEIIKEGQNKGLSGYESLADAGLICSPIEILEYSQ